MYFDLTTCADRCHKSQRLKQKMENLKCGLCFNLQATRGPYVCMAIEAYKKRGTTTSPCGHLRKSIQAQNSLQN